MTFEFVPSEAFYELLYKDEEFCSAIGKVMLSAGRLETNLRSYLRDKAVKGVADRSTLGSLVRVLNDNNLLSRNGQMHFNDLVTKRNYLAHSLYDLFSNVIEQTILPNSDLTESDVEHFTERAEGLAQDFTHFSNLVLNAKRDGGLLV